MLFGVTLSCGVWAAERGRQCWVPPGPRVVWRRLRLLLFVGISVAGCTAGASTPASPPVTPTAGASSATASSADRRVGRVAEREGGSVVSGSLGIGIRLVDRAGGLPDPVPGGQGRPRPGHRRVDLPGHRLHEHLQRAVHAVRVPRGLPRQRHPGHSGRRGGIPVDGHRRHAGDARPGQTANALLRIVEAGNYSPATCTPTTTTYLQIYPPNQTTPIYLGYKSTGCAASSVKLLSVSVVTAGTGG